jgi:hypothetical protein
MLAQLVAGPPAPQVSTATGSVACRLLHVGRPHKTDCLAPRRCCRVWARHCPRTLRQEVGPTAVSRLPCCRFTATCGASGVSGSRWLLTLSPWRAAAGLWSSASPCHGQRRARLHVVARSAGSAGGNVLDRPSVAPGQDKRCAVPRRFRLCCRLLHCRCTPRPQNCCLLRLPGQHWKILSSTALLPRAIAAAPCSLWHPARRRRLRPRATGCCLGACAGARRASAAPPPTACCCTTTTTTGGSMWSRCAGLPGSSRGPAPRRQRNPMHPCLS